MNVSILSPDAVEDDHVTLTAEEGLAFSLREQEVAAAEAARAATEAAYALFVLVVGVLLVFTAV